MKKKDWIALVSLVAALCIFLLLGSRKANAPVPADTGGDTDPVTKEETLADREVARTGEVSDLVVVTSPMPNSTVSSPVEVTGEAPGYWFFEAVAPVNVVNWDGLIIGEGFVTATEDWMTEDVIGFEGTVSYTLTGTEPNNNGWLILKRDNPSGLPENDAAVEIPIVLN